MRRGDDQSALPCLGALADALLSGLPSSRGCPDSTAPGLHTVRAPRPLESGGRSRVKEPTGLARVALMHLAHAARWGVPRAGLLREARLDEEQLRVPDPALGLRLGTAVRARDFGLVGYTMALSQTVAAALKRLTRYDRLLSDAL